MTSTTPAPVVSWSTDFQEKLETFERLTFGVLIACIALAGLVPLAMLRLNVSVTPLILSLSCLLAAGLLLLLQRLNYLAAAWAAVLISFAILWSFLALLSLEIVASLFFLPCALAVLAISRRAGLATAIGISLFLLWCPPAFLPLQAVARYGIILASWAVVGLFWLTLNPLLSTVQWAWSGYQHSLALLEESRATQVQLSQALEDLSGMNTQLTHLNRLAQNLRQVAEEERALKQQFVANVSHELRTPLNMIIGFSEMMAEARRNYGVTLPPAMQADLAVVLRNSQHLSSLVDDILDLSQIEAGEMALTRERSSLEDIIQAAMEAVRPLFESKNLSLKLELAEQPLPLVLCDRVRIREVVLNLLSNAGRFTEKGGVTIRVQTLEKQVRVGVQDTGPGISPADQERLFQPFHQVEASIQRRRGGTGLGLSISKRFVELHAGRMWVESNLGAGTTFFFSLPVEPDLPLEAGALRWIDRYGAYTERARPLAIRPSAAPPRIVVYEKGELLGRILRRYLEPVDIASWDSLNAALVDLEQNPAQALLINTEHVNETLHELEKHPRFHSGLPVLVCSMPDAAVFQRDARVAGHLVKPVLKDTLLAALDNLGSPVQTILLVDDEPDILQLFRRILLSAGKGYQVLRAENGKQALEIIAQKRPDVIFLDLAMPEMDGAQFLAARDQDAALLEIPVILISARDPNAELSVTGQGSPVETEALAITLKGGLSVQQLLEYVRFTSNLLARADLPFSNETG